MTLLHGYKGLLFSVKIANLYETYSSNEGRNSSSLLSIVSTDLRRSNCVYINRCVRVIISCVRIIVRCVKVWLGVLGL